MVNFPPIDRRGISATTSRKPARKAVVRPSSTDQDATHLIERRGYSDRRVKKDSNRVMDRRNGSNRRTPRINFSV